VGGLQSDINCVHFVWERASEILFYVFHGSESSTA
jgi:hypothetical protein